jgi:preprotein translocase subunit Sec61beta
VAYSNPALFLETYLNLIIFLLFKMAKDQIRMPSGMGGLVRYFDEYKSKIEFKPGHVILLCIIIIIVMILLYSFGNSWLGM